MRWDIFCKVIDNFGDAGVAWRLARQLQAEQGADVRLIIDDMATLARLDRRVRPDAEAQTVDGITVMRWGRPLGAVADVVVETFACEAPPQYVEAMAERSPAPPWINLEYLSAEDWVGRCHRLPSPHPRHLLTRHFFFPGFGPETGGLLRERGLLAARDAFQGASAVRDRFWQDLALPSPAAEEQVVTLFGYDTVQVHDLFDAWSASKHPVRCLIPDHTPLAARAVHHVRRPAGENRATLGALTLAWIPFRDQVDYDPLLWAADFNFVRGEDSFVRAQWAARPMAWHIYPQPGDAHRIKLEAFLEKYLAGLEPPVAQRVHDLFLAWNGEGHLGEAWNALSGDWSLWAAHAATWAGQLAAGPDLVSNLADFVEKLL
ncbi:MAG: elongation factor P maturation arginine rhamnosyltransferase EarP [Betaproteobacteria bacterium]|nr:elongation factor P maturation arginine rhamnosyltransferase EarP [Betaproteobacteria bacterium]